MVPKPSNPRLMVRVLDAVANLGDTKGSSAREVLSFIRQSNQSAKNLTVQVHRALKHAVNAGLLRHRSGRYKALATLNPTSALSEQETDNKDQKAEERKLKPDAGRIRSPIKNAGSSRRTQQRIKGTTSKRPNSKRRSNNARKESRRSNKPNRTIRNRKRKRTYNDEEFEDPPSGRYTLQGRDKSPISINRWTKRSKISKQEFQSDTSDESDCERDMKRKRVSQANQSSRRVSKRKEDRAKSRGRSTSRNRSLQRTQARQHPIEEIGKDRQQCNENCKPTECIVVHQESHVEGARESNDSNSTLENCD